MKYASKEGVKAYGYESNLTVKSVVVVPKLKDATAEKRQMAEQRNKGAAFHQILEEACESKKAEAKQPKVITCYTSGYTRDAKPFIYQVNSKEYCYPENGAEK